MKNTPQTKTVYSAIQQLGHATNQELHQTVSKTMPDLSITTVHRITKRLVEEGEAQCTVRADGVNVVDARIDRHDHFNCLGCGGIVDVDLPTNLVSQLHDQLGSNIVGSVAISGTCAACAFKQLSPTDTLIEGKKK